jgi:hypothetical protein
MADFEMSGTQHGEAVRAVDDPDRIAAQAEVSSGV